MILIEVLAISHWRESGHCQRLVLLLIQPSKLGSELLILFFELQHLKFLTILHVVIHALIKVDILKVVRRLDLH